MVPSLRLPAVVLEIVVGIVVGPSGLGWVEIDEPIAVLSLIGLAFLLFLAGLEVEFHKLRGRVLKLAGGGFLLSFAIAVAAGLALKAGGFVSQPLFTAIVLSATSLGIIVPLLKDSGESGSSFGQLVIAAGSIADFGAVILLTLFFSREATGTREDPAAGLLLRPGRRHRVRGRGGRAPHARPRRRSPTGQHDRADPGARVPSSS